MKYQYQRKEKEVDSQWEDITEDDCFLRLSNYYRNVGELMSTMKEDSKWSINTSFAYYRCIPIPEQVEEHMSKKLTQDQIESLQEETQEWAFDRVTKWSKGKQSRDAYMDAIEILLDVLGYEQDDIQDILNQVL